METRAEYLTRRFQFSSNRKRQNESILSDDFHVICQAIFKIHEPKFLIDSKDMPL